MNSQNNIIPIRGLGLWYLKPLLTIFQLYRGGQFNWLRKLEYQVKITENFSCNVVSSTPCHECDTNSQL